MLLQSQGDVIRLLPALPREWSDGRVTGLRARGGVTVDLAWAKGQLNSASIQASHERLLVIRTRGNVAATAAGRRIQVEQVGTDTFAISAKPGVPYLLTFAR